MAEVLQEIEDGEVVHVQGSASKPYELKNTGGVYSCSCPAWRNQSLPIESRTCKHLKKIRGAEAEAERVGNPEVATRVTAAATGGGSKPALLLAQKWEPHHDPTGWWMSEKLDGVRAYWNGQTFLSRLGNEFMAPDWFTDGFPEHPLDGELWLDRGAFQTTVSIVRRQDRGKQWQKIRYLIFDAPDHGGPFEDRLDFIGGTFADGVLEYASALAHEVCEGFDHLANELERIESLGGEGLMLREPKSAYVGSRSTSLLKVKTFFDAEAQVLGYTAGAGRHKGRVGALELVMKDGTRFSCGTGLSDAERDDPPAIGSVVTFRYQELTDGGVPRFPSYVGARADAEWPATTTVTSTAPKAVTRPAPKPTTSARSNSVTLRKGDEVWTYELQGNSFVVTMDDADGAAAEMQKQIAAKKKRGFVEAEVDDDGEPAEAGPTRRFEFVSGSSNKFWEIAVSGNTHTVRYGKIGSTGRANEKTFKDADAAQADADKLISQKLGKGYEEV